MNAPHCNRCGKALFQLRMMAGTNMSQMIINSDHYHDSDNKEICSVCDERLIRRGTEICCTACEKPILAFRNDIYKGKKTSVEDFKGIPPQRDLIEGVYNRCVHCRTIIEWG